EQDRELGTARLTALHFKDALIKIGLSWPSLTKILGRPTDPQRWAILYLGSVKAAAVLPDRDIVVVNKNGNAVESQDAALRGIEGIIPLDGTWSQAKALWWRNAWVLKCKRVVPEPHGPPSLCESRAHARSSPGRAFAGKCSSRSRPEQAAPDQRIAHHGCDQAAAVATGLPAEI